MNKKDLKNILGEYPNTLKSIKEYYLKEEREMEKFLTDDVLKISISSAPSSILKYFDTLGLIGTLEYNRFNNKFDVFINGIEIMDEDSHGLESSLRLSSADRNEAECLLVKNLLDESEKRSSK